MGREASLQHQGYYGTARVLGVTGRKAVEGATLVFNCEVELQPTAANPIEINEVVGRVEVEGAGDLGPCWLLNSVCIRSSDHAEKTSFAVCVAAKDGAIRAIDQHRARKQNQEFVICLWLQVRGRSSTGTVDSQAILSCNVTTSDWSSVLSAARYEMRHLIDVPIQGGRVAQALSVAAEHYRRALEQWQKVSYPQVLVECRKVLEATRDAYSLAPKGIAEFDARQKATWSTRECIEYARAAIHQIVHHAAHPGINDDPGPAEAELLLALTGSLLRYYASTR